MSQPTHYPPGTVRALLTTDHVSPRTREALTARLNRQSGPLRFFTDKEADTLQHLADRLIPQPPQAGYVVDLVSLMDQRLADNESDGWRYDVLPADQDAYRRALRGIDESAQALFGRPVNALTGSEQDELLRQVQAGTISGEVWQQLPANRFFEDMLAELAAFYYSHPLSQEAIGYVGMADKPAWTRIGLNNLEAREPIEQ